MNLYLLRHGEAEHQARSDSSRALTARGREDVINVAQHFVKKALPIDCCFVSPYLRAQQTAALFVPLVSDQIKIESESRLVPEVRAVQVIQFLEELDAQNVLLVSHNPLLSELVAVLIDGGIKNMHIVGTSELTSISLSIVGTGMGNHQFSLYPDV